MKKQHVIALVVAIVVIILICLIMILSGNKSNQGKEDNKNAVEFNPETDIDWENIEVTTIKFKLKNSTGKDISKIYMRNNRNENFTDDLAEDIKNGEEKEVEYGNYSPLYSWDMKFVFADGTEKALNSMLAANQLYNEATLELVELGDNIDAVNHDMATFDAEIPAETAETTEPAQTEENTEESNPGNEEAEVENVDETTPTTEETVENEEVSGETEGTEDNTNEATGDNTEAEETEE